MSIVNNKKAYYEYHILEEYDAGIMLVGGEVKSIRDGNVVLNDSFIYLKDNEVWIKNLKISKYKQSHPLVAHDDNRDKKLLLTKKEISKLSKKMDESGITCIPLSIFIRKNKIKLKIGLGRGKKLWDKRQSIKDRDVKRELQRGL